MVQQKKAGLIGTQCGKAAESHINRHTMWYKNRKPDQGIVSVSQQNKAGLTGTHYTLHSMVEQQKAGLKGTPYGSTEILNLTNWK